jgi:thiol-disulfide isomerase/thioredoxin
MKTIIAITIFIALIVYIVVQMSGSYHNKLLGDSPIIFDSKGNIVDSEIIKNKKYLMLYFSASWCGPCHKFNPDFIKWYEEHDGGNNFEVILVGSDEDTDAIKDYMNDQKMPFMAFEKRGSDLMKLRRNMVVLEFHV